MDISWNYKHVKQRNSLGAPIKKKKKNRSLEVVKVVLVRCNLVNNQYQ